MFSVLTEIMFLTLFGPVLKILNEFGFVVIVIVVCWFWFSFFFFLFFLRKTEGSFICITNPDKIEVVLWEKEIQKTISLADLHSFLL